MQAIIQDKTFTKTDLLPQGEYENCIFNACDLAESNLADYQFNDCTFNDCNLSMANITQTAFRDVSFKDCKLLGLQFDACNAFGLALAFEGCLLNHASFYKTKLKKTLFKDSQLHETDFTEADLSAATFDNCNLTRAVFDRTNLEKADFRSAYNYSIDPEANRVKRAKFAITGVAGLLDKYNIDIER